jgi:hypothetical protein
MGDRGNIVIRSEWPEDLGDKEAVFLYGHWSGSELPETLRAALDTPQARDRWTDAPYLARIIFDQMVGESQGSATGYGISSRLTDNEYDLLVLRVGRVYVLRESEYNKAGFTALDERASLSIEDYIDATERTWDNLASEFGMPMSGDSSDWWDEARLAEEV